MKTHGEFTHLTFEFGPGYERRNRVHHDEIQSAAGYQLRHHIEGLLAVIGLRDDQFIQVHPEGLRVGWVQCMLGIDKCCDTALGWQFEIA